MLCEILSERRRSIGMSIDQLVEKSGVPKGTLTKVLTGVSPNPALETVKAIAYAMGLSLDDLTESRNTKLTDRAVRIAIVYDSLTNEGKELMDSLSVFAEKYHKQK